MPVSYYLSGAFGKERFKRTLRVAIKTLREYDDTFDAIAVRGTSGLLFGPTLALYLKKDLIVVRKPGDSNHKNYDVETWLMSGSYLIVDDCVGFGTTIKTIREEITKMYAALVSNGHVYKWGTDVYEVRKELL